MMYLQGLLKAHRHRAQFLKQNIYPGLGLYLTFKGSEILLFLVNLQTHGHIVTEGFFIKQSFSSTQNHLLWQRLLWLTFKMHRVAGCAEHAYVILFSLSLAEYI